MKGYLIDVRNGTAGPVEIAGGENDTENAASLKEYYKLIGCDCIDITSRKIGGKFFDLVVDDNGLYSDNAIVSAMDGDGEPRIVGNIVVMNVPDEDGDGYMKGLTDADIALIQRHVQNAIVSKTGKGVKVLVGVED